MEQQYPQDVSSFPTPPPPSRKRAGVISVVCALILVLAVAVILNETVLRIRWVSVQGIRAVSWAEVIQAAGLDKPTSYFAVSESRIAEGVNSHRYLTFERLEKHFPDSLTIYVSESVPVALVEEMNAKYFLDAGGMVLERGSLRNGGALEDMVVVTGLKPKDLRVGQTVVPATVDHLNAYRALFDELRQQGFLSEISELNITDPESIYVVTRDGFIVQLGDIDSLRAKIGTVRAVVFRLREMEKTGGIVDASVPAEAIYSPPNQ